MPNAFSKYTNDEIRQTFILYDNGHRKLSKLSGLEANEKTVFQVFQVYLDTKPLLYIINLKNRVFSNRYEKRNLKGGYARHFNILSDTNVNKRSRFQVFHFVSIVTSTCFSGLRFSFQVFQVFHVFSGFSCFSGFSGLVAFVCRMKKTTFQVFQVSTDFSWALRCFPIFQTAKFPPHIYYVYMGELE